MWWGTFDFDSQFDWGADYSRPAYGLKDLVIYEMSVRCFTASQSSGLPAERRGTYLGVADKVSSCMCSRGMLQVWWVLPCLHTCTSL